MPFYREHIYPQLVSRLGDPEPIRKIRQQIVRLAEGDVLEIGVGPGVNFPHYDCAQTTKVYALEPNPGMIRLAENRLDQTKLNVEFIGLPGERIPLGSSSIDTIVSTFTMCTIPGIVDAIREMKRVVKPGGKLVFFEHGLSPEPPVQRWQKRLEPLFRSAFEGCHLTRNIPCLIGSSGFSIQRMEQGYLAPFPKSPSYCWWGVAVPELQK